ncbi:MAG: hypothetical protein D4R67_07435 [Bacteroidetes bacterium]|nr:MAG: hypothetical protein D4R67_07435 [Bacteroidota bacterium]
MDERIARILSFLFHPLLIPTYLLGILFWLDSTYSVLLPLQMKLLVAGTVLVTTFIFPLFILFLLFRMKIITSFYLPRREERIFPLIILAIFYYLTFYLMKDIYLPRYFQLFILGATLLTIITMLITLGYRISMHMTAWGGVAGLFLGMSLVSGGYSLLMLIAAILLAGLTGSARLKLKAHQPGEIYSGWLMGALVMCLTAMLL